MIALAVDSLVVCGAVVSLVLSSMVYFIFFVALLSAIEDLAVYGAVFFQGPSFYNIALFGLFSLLVLLFVL